MAIKTKCDKGRSKKIRTSTLEKTMSRPHNGHHKGGLAKYLSNHKEAIAKLGEFGQTAHLEEETQKRKLIQNPSGLGFTSLDNASKGKSFTKLCNVIWEITLMEEHIAKERGIYKAKHMASVNANPS